MLNNMDGRAVISYIVTLSLYRRTSEVLVSDGVYLN